MRKILFALTAVLSASLVFAGEITTLVPDTVPAPFKNRFSHGKIVPADAEWLITAGQTGRKIDGTIGDGIEEQLESIWALLPRPRQQPTEVRRGMESGGSPQRIAPKGGTNSAEGHNQAQTSAQARGEFRINLRDGLEVRCLPSVHLLSKGLSYRLD